MADYCELCDLPLSTCVHGMPPPPPPPPKAAPAPRKAAARRAPTRPSPAPRAARRTAAPRRFTTPEALRPQILAVLEDAGGALEADEAFARLEARLADTMLAGDRQTTPEGELRWRLATRKARQSLIADGLLVAGPGEWRLS